MFLTYFLYNIYITYNYNKLITIKNMKSIIPLYKPYISKDTLKNVSNCIKQNWISSKGFYVKKFEKLFSKFTKIKYSVSVSNGTCAMHIALLSLGIKKNDEVIVPSFTYVATANPIKYVGAKAVFVESNLETLQIDIKKIEKKIYISHLCTKYGWSNGTLKNIKRL